jgi:hypothetical protein
MARRWVAGGAILQISVNRLNRSFLAMRLIGSITHAIELGASMSVWLTHFALRLAPR